MHRLPSLAIHHARLSQSRGERLRRPRSVPASNLSPIAFTTTRGRSTESPIPTGCAIIYTARTVSSRLPLIAHAFETERHARQAAQRTSTCPTPSFLKIHYKGVTEMPGDEADGCEPDVSPFEIATQSWHTFDTRVQRDPRPGVAGRARSRGATGGALRAEEHDRPELEDHVLLARSTAKNTAPQINTLIDKLYEYETARRRMAISVRQESQAGGLHLLSTRCWLWLKRAVGRKPTNTLLAP